MPDISKINALAIGSVSKVDGLAKASILDIDGVAVPSGSVNVPPLDTYTGAAAAYSVRLLRTAYTGDIMRVRRDSDNVEADVGFDSNNEFGLTSPISNTSDAQSYTDFADFVDHTGTPANGFVRTWYDQASSNDAEQSTEGNQPKIYDSSSGIIEEGATGKEKPAVQFSNSNFDISISQSASNYAAAIVERRPSTQSGWLFDSTSGRLILDARTNALYFDGSFRGANISSTSQDLVFLSLVSPSSGAGYVNGTAHDTGLSYTQKGLGGTTKLGSANTGSVFITGIIQEFVLWPSDQSGVRTGIEDNLNAYFQIF